MQSTRRSSAGLAGPPVEAMRSDAWPRATVRAAFHGELHDDAFVGGSMHCHKSLTGEHAFTSNLAIPAARRATAGCGKPRHKFCAVLRRKGHRMFEQHLCYTAAPMFRVHKEARHKPSRLLCTCAVTKCRCAQGSGISFHGPDCTPCHSFPVAVGQQPHWLCR